VVYNLALFTTAQRPLLTLGERSLLTIPFYGRWTFAWNEWC